MHLIHLFKSAIFCHGALYADFYGTTVTNSVKANNFSDDSDHSGLTYIIPRQSHYKNRELLDADRMRRTGRVIPYEGATIKLPRSQPHTETVMYEHFESAAAAVGEDIGVMWMCRAEHLNDARQRGIDAGTHVQRFTRKPNGVDTDHAHRVRRNIAHSRLVPLTLT